MVGIAGKSQGCNTCRRRKVRCDLAKPSCERCSASGRKCEGYEKYAVFINRGPEGLKKRERLEEARLPASVSESGSEDARLTFAPSSTQLNETQLISLFWENYAANAPRHSDSNEPVWLYHSINSPAHSTILRQSLVSVALIRLGRLHDDQALLVSGRQIYGQTLRMMQAALNDSELAYSDNTLVAARCMVLYESFESTSGDMAAWQNHIMGIARIIELRGAHRHRSVVARSVVESIRYNVMIVCLMRRRSSFFGEPQWLAEPWAGTSKGCDQRLFDYGFSLGTLMHKVETMQQQARRDGMLEILEQLRDGYLALSYLNEELLALREQPQQTAGGSSEKLGPDETPFTFTFGFLIALDLVFGSFTTALLQKCNEPLSFVHQELFDQLHRYADPGRRLRLARQLLRHVQFCCQTRAEYNRPRIIFPLNVVRWELRNSSPEEKAQVNALFESVSSKSHFRIADGVRNAGKSVLPPLVS
ncbi:hypothetical protein H2200_000371 [Cladophialophora chaetospira]|uniref:Zn(2)-C6 fungal-type domain-containing protein n=1 Tax=Cladophialophora chaetospira TaxID=386627 RepID=A0AA38XNF4_9EURO|nr:hypothetical protein H2200_000371 [Cladophialophora chaetospira]